MKPIYGVGNEHNDYGLGFYCTEHLELAMEWACASEDANGFANEYRLDASDLKMLQLDDSDVLSWLALLVANRTFDLATPTMQKGVRWLLSNHLVDISTYDAIVGYRADDSYFSFARAFLRNEISLDQLSLSLRLGNLGKQFVLKSPRTFEAISFVESHEASAETYFPKRAERDTQARNAFIRILSEEDEDSPYIRDLMKG